MNQIWFYPELKTSTLDETGTLKINLLISFHQNPPIHHINQNADINYYSAGLLVVGEREWGNPSPTIKLSKDSKLIVQEQICIFILCGYNPPPHQENICKDSSVPSSTTKDKSH